MGLILLAATIRSDFYRFTRMAMSDSGELRPSRKGELDERRVTTVTAISGASHSTQLWHRAGHRRRLVLVSGHRLLADDPDPRTASRRRLQSTADPSYAGRSNPIHLAALARAADGLLCALARLVHSGKPRTCTGKRAGSRPRTRSADPWRRMSPSCSRRTIRWRFALNGTWRRPFASSLAPSSSARSGETTCRAMLRGLILAHAAPR